jgi:DNA-binding beta-propeller fold protein YncE
MNAVLGEDPHRFEAMDGWAKPSNGVVLGEVAGVAVDGRDRVYVFNRGPNPMVVFDRSGEMVDTWGQDLFTKAHGVSIGRDNAIYCTDEGSHTVCKCTVEGKLLLRIGIPGDAATPMSGRPFNRCTHTALGRGGEIFVTDGYANAVVHKFAPDGRHLMTWGGPGSDRGQFNLPHNIVTDDDGLLYVADRENHRIQIFDGEGRYQGQWNNLHRPSALFMTPGPCPLCYVGEIAPYMAVNRDTPNLGPRVTILDAQGERVGRLNSQGGPGTRSSQFTSPHAIAVDSHGDLYVGEVTASAWPSLFPGQPLPKHLNSLKKFRRIPEAGEPAAAG